MEYLLEVRWDDPTTNAVARPLAGVPGGMELTTGTLPRGKGRAFVAYRSDSLDQLTGLARTISGFGATVRVTPAAAGWEGQCRGGREAYGEGSRVRDAGR